MAQLVDDDMARREALWIALADLWLDQAPSEGSLSSMADAVRRTGFTEGEADDIVRFELAPVLGANLRATAGVWNGFDSQWLCARVRRRVGKRGLLARLAAWSGWSMGAARAEWADVKDRAYRGS